MYNVVRLLHINDKSNKLIGCLNLTVPIYTILFTYYNIGNYGLRMTSCMTDIGPVDATINNLLFRSRIKIVMSS